MRRGLLRWRRPLVVPPAVEPVAVEPPPVAAAHAWPRLRVWALPSEPWQGWPTPWHWRWEVTAADGQRLAGGDVGVAPALPTQQAALEVGLANLAVCTAAWGIDVHGTDLPHGWEKITP